MKLLLQAVLRVVSGFALIALLLFLPAGGWQFWNAWL